MKSRYTHTSSCNMWATPKQTTEFTERRYDRVFGRNDYAVPSKTRLAKWFNDTSLVWYVIVGMAILVVLKVFCL